MNAHNARFIQLTILGSRTVRIAARPGVIDESAVSLWVECDHRVWNPDAKTWDTERTAYALTADQAREMVDQITEALIREGG
jgi:hypothetical protein